MLFVNLKHVDWEEVKSQKKRKQRVFTLKENFLLASWISPRFLEIPTAQVLLLPHHLEVIQTF